LTTYVRRAADARSEARSREISRNGAVALQSWTSSSSSGSTSSTVWVQEFVVCRSGSSPPASTAVPARCASRLALPALRASAVMEAGVCDLRERDAGREGSELGVDERRVGARRAAHGLARVVDEDVERAGRGDLVGERDHLGGVAQVDADDLEPVDPVGAVLQRREPSYGVVREARGDRGVRAVAEQPQSDVHADLGAAAGEQRAASGEVGALVALGVRHGGAAGAEPVVERVDERVVVLADVAAARVDQLAGEGARRVGDQRDAEGLVVDAHRGAGGRRLGHRAVGGQLGLPLAGAPLSLEGLVHVRRGVLDGRDVRVVARQPVQLVEHPHRDRQVVGVDALEERRALLVGSGGRLHRRILGGEGRSDRFGGGPLVSRRVASPSRAPV
jgi:hypothetical protein